MADKFEEPIGKKFNMPIAFLHQLSEMAPEGFILFFIDQNGIPQIRANFPAPIFEMGLRAHAVKFFKGMDMVEESSIAERIFEETGTDSEEDSN